MTTSALYVDNISAIKFIKNPVFHKKSKHIQVRHFFVRKKVADGLLSVDHVNGSKQIADILTKPLPRATHMLRGIMNGVNF